MGFPKVRLVCLRQKRTVSKSPRNCHEAPIILLSGESETPEFCEFPLLAYLTGFEPMVSASKTGASATSGRRRVLLSYRYAFQPQAFVGQDDPECRREFLRTVAIEAAGKGPLCGIEKRFERGGEAVDRPGKT